MSKSFRPNPPIVIGLTGGVASGKSTVAAMFAELGLVRLDADREARRVTELPETLAAIRGRFGDAVFGADGGLDRAALAQIVFEDPDARRDLEEIVHPAVRKALEAGIETAVRAGDSVVLDVPLLVEGGLVDRCDACIFVEATPAIRAARAAERGWGPDEITRREASQADLGVKKSRCRYTVDASGSLSDTRRHVEAVLARITKRDARPGA